MLIVNFMGENVSVKVNPESRYAIANNLSLEDAIKELNVHEVYTEEQVIDSLTFLLSRAPTPEEIDACEWEYIPYIPVLSGSAKTLKDATNYTDNIVETIVGDAPPESDTLEELSDLIATKEDAGVAAALIAAIEFPESGNMEQYALDPQFAATEAGKLDLYIEDVSVNNAKHWIKHNGYLVQQTRPRVSAAGSFGGSGTGNKAILNMHGFNNTLLSNMPKFEVTFGTDAASIAEISYLFINAYLDLDNGTKHLMTFFARNNTPAKETMTEVDLGSFRYTRTFDPAIHLVGTALSPDIAGVTKTINEAGTEGRYAIADILAIYPTAKFIDAITLDGGLPKNTMTTAFILASGSSSNQLVRKYEIEDMKINDQSVFWKMI